MTNKILLPASIVLAGLIAAGAFFYFNQAGVLAPEEVAEMAINYINENFDIGDNTASLVSVVDEGSVYKIKLTIGEQEYESFATKDGKLLFPDGYELTPAAKEETSNQNQTINIEKRDRPDVKLFVMSYCPYGLQAQKVFLPVSELLGDKADMGVYFVDYIMHEKQEIDENLRQYCIQKEEKGKYTAYLTCFTQTGDYQECFSQAGIVSGRNTNCFFETDKDFMITALYNNKETWLSGLYPQFPLQTELNDQYGVQGSPTLVINDQVINLDPRSPENLKSIVCQAFNSPPEECSQTLSVEVPSIGFGGGTGSSGGSCQ